MKLLCLLLLVPLLACGRARHASIRARRAEAGAGHRRRHRRRRCRRTPRSTRSSAKAAGRASKTRGRRRLGASMLALRYGGAGAAKQGDSGIDAGVQRRAHRLERHAGHHRRARPRRRADRQRAAQSRPSWRSWSSSPSTRDAAAELRRAGQAAARQTVELPEMRAAAPVLAAFAVAAGATRSSSCATSNINKMLDTAKNVGKATQRDRRARGDRDRPRRRRAPARRGAAGRTTRRCSATSTTSAAGSPRRPSAPTCRGSSACSRRRSVNAFAVPGGTIFVTRGLVRAHAERSRARRRARPRDLARAAQAPPQGDPEGRADRARRRRAAAALQNQNAGRAREADLASARRCTRAASTSPTSSKPTASAW